MNEPSHHKLVELALQCQPRAAVPAEFGAAVHATCLWPDEHAIALLTGQGGPWRRYFPRRNPRFNFEIRARSFRPFLPKLGFFIRSVVACLRRGEIEEAGRFAGVFSHYLGDFAEPAHYYELDIGRLLPPPEDMVNCNYHFMIEAIESGRMRLAHTPRLLGESAGEFQFRLEGRFMALHARGVAAVLPMVKAIYERRNDRASRVFDGVMTDAAAILADFIHTARAVAAREFEPAAAATLSTCDLRAIGPHTFDVEFNFGHAPLLDAVTIENFGRARPFRLRRPRGRRTGAEVVPGICAVPHALPLEGASLSSELHYRLPRGVFDCLSALVGLQADHARQAACRFEVLVDGRLAHTTDWRTPASEAVPVRVGVAGARDLRLRVVTDGSTDKLAFPIWGEPQLIKT